MNRAQLVKINAITTVYCLYLFMVVITTMKIQLVNITTISLGSMVGMTIIIDGVINQLITTGPRL